MAFNISADEAYFNADVFGDADAETEKIIAFFHEKKEVAIAFSGGVDSAVLLLLAAKYAQRTKAYYVKSQFQPQFELDDAVKTAEMLHIEMEIIPMDVLLFHNIVANSENRCYYCKKEIFSRILKHAEKDGFHTVLDGTNASDDISDRPGFKALQELEVLSPLKICGYTKSQIRRIAKQYNLIVADKPSYACLATRIPTDTVISGEELAITEKAENEMREIGFRNFRIRYINGDAKLELSRRDFVLFNEIKDKVCSVLSNYYQNVYLDLKERADD